MTTAEPDEQPAPEHEPETLDEAAQEGDEQPVVEQQHVEQQPEHVQLVRAHRDGSERVIAGTDLSIVPRENEIGQLAQMAVTLSAAAAVPTALRGRPNDVFLLLLTARDTGVALTTAMREFHVIEGKVTLSPKVKLAMVRQQGLGRIYPHQAPRRVAGTDEQQLCPCGKGDDANNHEEATWHAERRDEPGILHSSTFTIEQAQRVGLVSKDNWKNYPERMLSWRALGYLLDDVFGEVGTGLYSPDEMGAVTDEQGEPVIDVIGHAEPLPGTSAPRGHNAPPPEQASDEQRAAIKARIDSLPPDGRAALVSMWTEGKGTDAGPRLPPLRALMARDVKKAEAMVLSFEQRAKRGEWGDWQPPEPGGAAKPPEGPESPPDAPAGDAVSDAPESADDAQSAPEQPAGDESAGDSDDEQPTLDDEASARITDQVIADVAAMSDHDVRAALVEMGKSRNGTDKTVRTRLAMWRAKAAGVKVTEQQIKQATEDD